MLPRSVFVTQTLAGTMQNQDRMTEVQLSYVAKLLKKHFPTQIMTSDLRKEFSRCLSVFIFYIQAFQSKKTYTKDDLISTLYRNGLGGLGDKMSEWVIKDAKETTANKITSGNVEDQNIVAEDSDPDVPQLAEDQNLAIEQEVQEEPEVLEQQNADLPDQARERQG